MSLSKCMVFGPKLCSSLRQNKKKTNHRAKVLYKVVLYDGLVI